MATSNPEPALPQLQRLSLARLRAWAEQGVPIRGEWSSRWIAESSAPNQVSAALRPCLEVACTLCEASGFGAYEESMEQEPAPEPMRLARRIEKAAVERLSKARCTHCDKLAAPEPPDFEAMAALLAVETPDLLR
jgi:hypothetical protein